MANTADSLKEMVVCVVLLEGVVVETGSDSKVLVGPIRGGGHVTIDLPTKANFTLVAMCSF